MLKALLSTITRSKAPVMTPAQKRAAKRIRIQGSNLSRNTQNPNLFVLRETLTSSVSVPCVVSSAGVVATRDAHLIKGCAAQQALIEKHNIAVWG